MFQPAAFTGRADSDNFNPDEHRITIPDVVKEIEKNKHVKPGDFNPVPCSHYSCFAVSYYLIIDDDWYLSLKEFLGMVNYVNMITNKAYPGLDEEGFKIIRERIDELWYEEDLDNVNERILKRIREIFLKINISSFSLEKVFNLGVESMKNIFIHQFQDVHTLDFDRLVTCCNHYAMGDGRIVPMCAQNVFFQK